MGCGPSASRGQVAEPSQPPQSKPSLSNNNNSDEKLDSIEENEPTNITKLISELESKLPEGHILPHPGFIIKTVNISNNKKTFINVFHHDDISSDNILSLPLVIVDDKKGEMCDAYNVSISTHCFNQSENDPNFKDNLIVLILKQLKEKYKFDSATLSVKLPHIKRRFVGEEIPLFSLHPAEQPLAHSCVVTFIDDEGSDTTTEKPHADEEKDQRSVTQNDDNTSLSVVEQAVEMSAALDVPPSNDVLGFSEELPSSLSCPPKMQGWIRKQGHVVKSWKMRYFVLNKGYLTYFADKGDIAPFGTNLKGQLCLAGFREKTMYESSQQNGMQLSIANSEVSGRRQSSGLFSSDPMFRIQLVYIPGQVSLKNLKKLYPSSEGVPSVQEFLMEATTLEEKYAWLAAVSEHTSYLEQALTNELLPDPNDFNETNNNDIPNSNLTQDTTASDALHRTVSVNTNEWARKHPKATQYVRHNEEIVYSGLVGKPNPVGIHLIRQLFLIVNKEVSEERPYHKRLLYLDSNSYDMKGEVLWSAKAPKIEVKKGNNRYFDVVQGRLYRFYPRDTTTVDQWIEQINSLDYTQ